MLIQGFVSCWTDSGRQLRPFKIEPHGADLNYRRVRWMIGQQLRVDLRTSNLLVGGVQKLWSEAISPEWFLDASSKLMVFCPDPVTLRLKLLGVIDGQHSITKIVDITIAANCSARNIRSELLRAHGVDVTHLCHGGRKISLYGKEPHSYDPFLFRYGLLDGAELFAVCNTDSDRMSSLHIEPVGSTSDLEVELAGANSPPISRKKIALNDTTTNYGVYTLTETDLRVPLFALTKRVAKMFDLHVAKTRLLFAGNDLSSDHKSPKAYGATIGTDIFVVEDDSLLEVHPIRLNIALPKSTKGEYVGEQFEAEIGKRSTVHDLQLKLVKRFDTNSQLDIPRVFHGGNELKSHCCLFATGLSASARLDIIFPPLKNVDGTNTNILGDNETASEPISLLTEKEPKIVPPVGQGSDMPYDGGEVFSSPASPLVADLAPPMTFEGYKTGPKAMQKDQSPSQMAGIPKLMSPSSKWFFECGKNWETFPGIACADIEQAFVGGFTNFQFSHHWDNKEVNSTIIFDKHSDINAPHILQTAGSKDFTTRARREDTQIMEILRWESFNDDELGGVTIYENDVAEALERAYQDGKDSQPFRYNGSSFRVSFDYDRNIHEEQNLQTSESRHVRRYELRVGEKVVLPYYSKSFGASGTLRYLGREKTCTAPIGFKRDIFAGIELESPAGENDGSHANSVYFRCRKLHGVVCQAALVVGFLNRRAISLEPPKRSEMPTDEILRETTTESDQSLQSLRSSISVAGVEQRMSLSSSNFRSNSVKATDVGLPPQPTADDGSIILMQGKLDKRSHSKKWRMAYDWKERLFVVTINSLMYYKVERRKQDVKREEKRSIKMCDIKNVSVCEQVFKGRDYLIQIDHTGGQLVCQCDDERMQSHWVAELRRIMTVASAQASTQAPLMKLQDQTESDV